MTFHSQQLHPSPIQAKPTEPPRKCAGRPMGLAQGVIDCLLTCPDGISRAHAAITNIWTKMTTPGIWISVSHSPPSDRRDLYNLTGNANLGASSIFWHNFQVLLAPLHVPRNTARDRMVPTSTSRCVLITLLSGLACVVRPMSLNQNHARSRRS